MNETPLTGGGRTTVVRRGDTVVRETGSWAPTVHALLRHLEEAGFSGAPRVKGSGFDDRGRETLEFIEGEVVHPGPWDEAALPHLGNLLRELHAAAATFTAPDDAVWRPWHGRSMDDGLLGIGHCDTGPWNIISRDGLPIAFIDWEVAGPVTPLVDLAQTCWLNAQLHAEDVAETQGLGSLEERARHVRLILDGYELAKAQRVGFVDRMIEFAVRDAAAEAIEAGVKPDTQDSSALWGVTWRIKSADWMLRHRGALQTAL